MASVRASVENITSKPDHSTPKTPAGPSSIRCLIQEISGWNSTFLAGTSMVQILAAMFCLAICSATAVRAQVNVTTWQNDIGRTGQNLNETILNTTNVTPTLFGKLFAQPVDGQVYAQPLYVSGVKIGGVAHNVIYVATENDSVYAFDADNNGGANAKPLWMASMLSTAHGAASGATTVASKYVGSDISPQVGITGTPVIDTSTNTLYVVSKSLENGAYPQRLHALDITTGAEKFGGPILITATVSGTGSGSVNGTLTFDSLWENQRPGLLLLNGIVYVGFAAHGDNGPWHGWILGYNAATLKQTGAYCASPNGTGSGFWMSGEGLAADQLTPSTLPFGRMFVPTGNGDYNATKPYTNAMDYGETHLNLNLANGNPTVTDEFTTNKQAALTSEDGDVGSGGLMVIPTQTTGSYPHLAVQVGKAGTMFLLNRDNLGGYNTTTDQAIQEQLYATPNGAWSTPAYWNGNVYLWGRYDNLRAFKLTNGLLSTTPTLSTEQYGFPGATPSISANGTSQGIVWSINSEGYPDGDPAVLQAHDASNVATTLYSSDKNSTRDNPGVGVKFTVPTVVNGKVYVGTATEIDVYGLLAGATQTDAPAISPGTESFTGSVSVTISDATPGATIYYTTNGSAATASSTKYTGPITVSSTETINAIASSTGLILSTQTSATFTSTAQAASPVFSLATGTYSTSQSVTISDSTTKAVIHYTLDGSTPTASSPVYSAALTVSATETVSAIAIATGYNNSPVVSKTYTIQTSASGISFGEGFAAAGSVMHFNGSTQLNDTRLQLTDGGTGEEGSAWYMTPVNVQSFVTDFTFQLSNPVSNGITFAIQNGPQNYYSLGGNGYALGYAPIPNSIAIKFDLYNSAGEGPDSTGLYVNGANPTVPSDNLTGTGIDLHSDDTMAVHLTYDGTTLSMTLTDIVTAAVYSTSWTINIPTTIGSKTAYVGFTGSTGAYTASQKILTWSFTTGTPAVAATPTFSIAAGTYATKQTVAISDATAGASIYYTTNGTTPTAASTAYTTPLTVSATETIKAVAISSTTSLSAVASALYTISSTTLTAPVISPGTGTYADSQTVTITGPAGAKIYVTRDGSTPTTASPLYSGSLLIKNPETTKAIAVTSAGTSSVTTAVYTLTCLSPTVTPASGTYSGTQIVTVTRAYADDNIYYTTNGTNPTVNSTKYTGPITVSASETLLVLAEKTGFTGAPIVSRAYTITPATAPTISYASGFTTTGLNLYGSTIVGSTLQLTDGGGGEGRVAWYKTPVNVQKFSSDFTFQDTSATGDGFTFTLQNSPAGIWAVGGNAGSLGYAGITSSLAVKFDLYNNSGEGSDSTGYYVNGATPTVPSVDITSSGVNLHSGDVLHAHLSYDGTTLTLLLTDTVTGSSFTTSKAINIPSTVGANTAYVGFTASTGSATAIQKVLTWTYTVN